MQLLVVEDQEHVLRLERMVLITDGFDVETCPSPILRPLRKLLIERVFFASHAFEFASAPFWIHGPWPAGRA